MYFMLRIVTWGVKNMRQPDSHYVLDKSYLVGVTNFYDLKKIIRLYYQQYGLILYFKVIFLLSDIILLRKLAQTPKAHAAVLDKTI